MVEKNTQSILNMPLITGISGNCKLIIIIMYKYFSITNSNFNRAI